MPAPDRCEVMTLACYGKDASVLHTALCKLLHELPELLTKPLGDVPPRRLKARLEVLCQ